MMKLIIGKRVKPLIELPEFVGYKGLCSLIEQVGIFLFREKVPVTTGPKRFDRVPCDTCQSSLEITISEDAVSGEIFLEFPNTCQGCGQDFTGVKLARRLTPDEIENLW